MAGKAAVRTANVNVDIDGVRVSIPVAREVKAYFTEQFVRDAPSVIQRKKYTTIMTLLRAAYKEGQKNP